jgi:hypothetical protein
MDWIQNGEGSPSDAYEGRLNVMRARGAKTPLVADSLWLVLIVALLHQYISNETMVGL